MRKVIEIKRIAPVLCGFYVGLFLFFVSFINVAQALQELSRNPMRIAMGFSDIFLVLVIPIGVGILGWVLGIIFSLIYNLLAKRKGLVLEIFDHGIIEEQVKPS